MVSIGRSDVSRFANLWTHRTQCLGCVHGMVEVCRAIAVICVPHANSRRGASLSLVSWRWSAREIMAGGMVDGRLWRHALCSLMHRQSGPSLLCAGQWSMMGLVVAGLAEDGICPRCKEAPENHMHRLWTDRANGQYRLQSNSLVPAAVSFPDSLPYTLARAGIPPAGWGVLSLEEFKCLLNYLWCCAADGTTALAREWQGAA